MTEDVRQLRAAATGADFTFSPMRLAAAANTLDEWIHGEVPDDVVEDFILARDACEAWYQHINALVCEPDGYRVGDGGTILPTSR